MTLEIDKIYNMDCLDGLEQIKPDSIDCVITDPPFNVNYNEKSKHLSKLKGGGEEYDKQVERDKTYIEYDIPYVQFLFKLKNVMKNNTHLYIFSGTEQMFKWYPAIIYAGFQFKDILIWLKNKQTFSLGMDYHYNYKTENCLFCSKGSRRLNKIGLCNVMEYDTGNSLIHPCQKPIDMISWLIRNSTNEGDIVLDPFMGSGTTALACKRSNRHFIGFEISKEYFEMCNNRINDNIKRYF